MKLAIVNFTRDHSPRKERERRLIFPNHRRIRLPSSFPHGLMQSQGLAMISLRRRRRAHHKVIQQLRNWGGGTFPGVMGLSQ